MTSPSKVTLFTVDKITTKLHRAIALSMILDEVFSTQYESCALEMLPDAKLIADPETFKRNLRNLEACIAVKKFSINSCRVVKFSAS